MSKFLKNQKKNKSNHNDESETIPSELSHSKTGKKEIQVSVDYQAIFAAVLDGILIIEKDGNIYNVNDTVLQTFGYSREKLVGQDISKLLKLDDAKFFKNNLSNEQDILAAHKSGDLLPVTVTISEIESQSQQMFMCTIRDNSQKNIALTNAKQAENQLLIAIEALQDGFVIYDNNDKLLMCNQKFKDLHQDFSEIIEPGIKFKEILEESVNHQHYPGAVGNEQAYFTARYAQHKMPSGPIKQRLKGDRTVCFIEQKTDQNFTIGLIIDISDLKKKELALEKSENQLRKTIETAIDAVLIVDANGNFIDFNKAAEFTFGYEREEILGQNLIELLIPKVHRENYISMKNELDANSPSQSGKRIEIEALHKTGKIFQIELSIQMANTPEGPIYISFARDITEKKASELALIEAKDRAEMANQAQTNFLAMMSHEIRTPLNGVLGILSLLDDLDLSDKQKQLVSTGNNSGNALLRIINDILDISKIEAGKLELEVVNFALEDLINSTFNIISPKAREKNITLRKDVQKGLDVNLSGDMERIRQVLLNLANNAVKFTEEGFVTIRNTFKLQENGNVEITFYIVDTGIGIPDEKKHVLFKKFKTVDPSYQRKEGGTGLGLAISKKIVTSMNGSIGVKSNDLGGSTFWFSLELPIAKDIKETMSKSFITKNAPIKPDDHKYHLLIAEDNSTNAMIAKTMLEKAGYTIHISNDGKEAIDAVQSFDFDLILMDIGMPIMDGTAATAAIRQLENGKANIPIIALTAHVMKDKRMAKMLTGMDDYLSKPINRPEMLEKIFDWLISGKRHDRRKVNLAEQRLLGSANMPQKEHIEEARRIGTLKTIDSIDSVVLDKVPFSSELTLNKGSLLQLAEDTDPEIVPDLVEDFITSSKERYNNIIMAAKEDNLSELQHHAHALCSSAATFGAFHLRKLVQHIEQACKDNEINTARNFAKHIGTVGENTEKELRSYVSKN